MDIHVWFYFALACCGLALTPGPNALLVITHSIRFGPAITLYTIFGGILAFVLLMTVSLFGIDVLLNMYPSFLTYLKFAGGMYLIWLGFRQWRLRTLNFGESAPLAASINRFSLFTQGAASAGANPKVFLFFGAFLSQFIDPTKDTLLQFVVMVATFAAVEFLVELAINLTAGRFRAYLAVHGKAFSLVCGAIFMTVGGLVMFMQ
ncbi:LysE family translocator [Pectobacterium aroidearum]|uniref:LysE family translocator n=1 Tax=Pectobacterium aroidearum TaxID=1201031 RepID=UPI00211401FC|nr:LysE family translocator [Pectobacterium aroidearum]UUE57374.1 LysE family translocator [Pectobacterium aroidearum]UUE70079.1 LysE family translocator [Pectobacterium aroidearum]UUE74456.1 LysE family translocator [Pectobacterium aroidearum]UUE78787.1 LysE family translocator [Pectobacterium aroidearum]